MVWKISCSNMAILDIYSLNLSIFFSQLLEITSGRHPLWSGWPCGGKVTPVHARKPSRKPSCWTESRMASAESCSEWKTLMKLIRGTSNMKVHDVCLTDLGMINVGWCLRVSRRGAVGSYDSGKAMISRTSSRKRAPHVVNVVYQCVSSTTHGVHQSPKPAIWDHELCPGLIILRQRGAIFVHSWALFLGPY